MLFPSSQSGKIGISMEPASKLGAVAVTTITSPHEPGSRSCWALAVEEGGGAAWTIARSLPW